MEALAPARTVVPPVAGDPWPVVAGARVVQRLAGPSRSVPVVHRGRDAVYLDLDGWCLGVVTAAATAVPCAVVLGARDADLSHVRGASVVDGAVVLDGQRLVVRRVADVVVPRLGLSASDDTERAARLLLAHAGVAVTELGGLVRRHGPSPEHLLGRGSGLTPLGDDVLAGWAATSYAFGDPVTLPDPRPRTALLSATLLDCARRGEALPQLRAVLRALATAQPLDPAASALAAVGHTSGAGLLLGAGLRVGHAVGLEPASLLGAVR